MEPSIQITEDSRSILQYMQPSKKQLMKQKKQRKIIEKEIRARKNSTQLSLSGWLVKNRAKQNCAIIHLQKSLIMNIYSYLRICQIVSISQTCFYLYQCARSIWTDPDFFKELQTDKLTHEELRRIFEKGGKMSHIKQLRNIYMGKNLRSCRQKIKLKVHDTNHSFKPLAGNLLQVFQVSTKANKSSSAFLMDSHLQQIINSSFRSLVTMKLQSCRYIRKFTDLAKCTQLVTLYITQNSYLSNEDMRVITKNCAKIQYLDISGCDNLDQGLLKHISKLIYLKTLTLNSYQQPLGDIQCMRPLTSLSQINMQNSCIMDIEAINLVKELVSLKIFNICGCQLLTDYFIDYIVSVRQEKLELKMGKNRFGEQALQAWELYSLKYKQIQEENQNKNRKQIYPEHQNNSSNNSNTRETNN